MVKSRKKELEEKFNKLRPSDDLNAVRQFLAQGRAFLSNPKTLEKIVPKKRNRQETYNWWQSYFKHTWTKAELDWDLGVSAPAVEQQWPVLYWDDIESEPSLLLEEYLLGLKEGLWILDIAEFYYVFFFLNIIVIGWGAIVWMRKKKNMLWGFREKLKWQFCDWKVECFGNFWIEIEVMSKVRFDESFVLFDTEWVAK